MVTIKKIEIKGFFGKGDLERNLNPVVNILGGKNGSGKSTIFKFCYSLLSNDAISDANYDEIQKVFKEVTLTFSNDWKLKWNPNVGLSYDTSKMISDRPTPFRICTFVEDEAGKERQFDELKQQINVYMINSFEQHLDQAIQYWQRPKSVVLDNPTMLDLMIYDQIVLRNSDFAETMESFIDTPNKDVEMQQYTAYYKKVYSELNHFLDGYDDKISSSFEFTKDGVKISYEHLSMGGKQILLLLLIVGNTKQAPCVFFMDDPDLCMHIDRKEELVTRLHNMNPNMQIILSTHSPIVITGWMDCVNEVSQLIKK